MASKKSERKSKNRQKKRPNNLIDYELEPEKTGVPEFSVEDIICQISVKSCEIFHSGLKE